MLMEYLKGNELFWKFQSGFRNHHSHEAVINHIIELWEFFGL